jgi:hypothetical protein
VRLLRFIGLTVILASLAGCALLPSPSAAESRLNIEVTARRSCDPGPRVTVHLGTRDLATADPDFSQLVPQGCQWVYNLPGPFDTTTMPDVDLIVGGERLTAETYTTRGWDVAISPGIVLKTRTQWPLPSG